MVAPPELIAWTRDTLERVFDLAYLARTAQHRPASAPHFDGARQVQAALLAAIQQLKPTPDVPATSLAWRIYNAVECRYVRGLTQAEAAAGLNISLRQLRREQDRGIEAVAALLFGSATLPAPGSAPGSALEGEGKGEGEGEGEREFVRLDDLLLAVLKLLDPLLARHNLRARLRLPSPAPVARTNGMALRQWLIMSISGLIRRAADATLEVEGSLDGSRICLTLSIPAPFDSLPPEEQRLLDQLAQSAGVLSVLPEIDGAGARLTLCLPASTRAPVLMIDDSVDSIELTRRYLEKTQYDLIGITRPEETLQQAQAIQPACIVLDVMMPGHDGWEVLSLLKSHPETSRIPVVVSSVLRNQDLACALGAEAVLPKPHGPEQLIAALAAATKAADRRA